MRFEFIRWVTLVLELIRLAIKSSDCKSEDEKVNWSDSLNELRGEKSKHFLFLFLKLTQLQIRRVKLIKKPRGSYKKYTATVSIVC